MCAQTSHLSGCLEASHRTCEIDEGNDNHEPQLWVHNRDRELFLKPLIEHTPKISLKKHTSPQNHHLVFFAKGIWSPSQYQVKSKYQVHFTKI